MPAIKIICGLGNPPEIAPEDSLHNVGFKTLDTIALAEAQLPDWRHIDDALVCTLEDEKGSYHLVKPLYRDINSSGVPAKKIMDRFGCAPEELLVVHDDIDLPAGKIKIKGGQSADRHNGVRSIARELDSEEFVRLKGGVGRPADRSVSIVEWVKERMDPELMPAIGRLVEKLAATLTVLRREGIDKARAFASR